MTAPAALAGTSTMKTFRTRTDPSSRPPAVAGATWVQLTQGKWALVDDADAPAILGFSWFYVAGGGASTGYARRSLRLAPSGNGRRPSYRPVPMHHFILGLRRRGLVVDHINGNGLDNRRSNLRLVTPQQNCANRTRARSDSKVGLVGVSPRPDGAYRVHITRNGKRYWLGVFGSLETAEAARLGALRLAEKIYGV